MAKPTRRDDGAFWLTAVLVVAIVLGSRFGWPGAIIAAALAVVTFAAYWRSTRDPEVDALRSSLAVACEDITQVIEEYEDLANGQSTDAIADRTLNYPALVERDSGDPAIEDFHLRLGSAKRFVGRVDKHLLSNDLDRHALERLLNIADQRAEELEESWSDARRAARKLGPGK